MFSIGFFEIILLLLLVLFVFKPAQLADTAKSLGRLLYKIRAYTSELEHNYLKQEKELDLQKRITDAAKVSDVSDLTAKNDEQD
jgi:Sec-independent protein translocase protein TatA